MAYHHFMALRTVTLLKIWSVINVLLHTDVHVFFPESVSFFYSWPCVLRYTAKSELETHWCCIQMSTCSCLNLSFTAHCEHAHSFSTLWHRVSLWQCLSIWSRLHYDTAQAPIQVHIFIKSRRTSAPSIEWNPPAYQCPRVHKSGFRHAEPFYAFIALLFLPLWTLPSHVMDTHTRNPASVPNWVRHTLKGIEYI